MSISAEKIAVALVSPQWPAGASANGIATYTENLVPWLVREGIEAFVMSRHVHEKCQDPFVERLAVADASQPWIRRPISALMMRMTPQLWAKRRASRSILDGLASLRLRADLKLLEMEEAQGFAPFVAAQAAIPVVVRMHGPWFLVGPLVGAANDRKFASRNRAERLALAGAAAVSAPSRDVLNRARSFFGLELKNAVVIPNPCPLYEEGEQWNLERSAGGDILFVGRFDRCKGADVMIDAFAQVGKEFPESRLVFVGPDNGLTDDAGRKWQIDAYAAERLKEDGLLGRMQWLGRRTATEIQDLRRRARVTVVCSRYENFPMVALEAMSMGCPLVASSIGGLTEMIQDGKNGLLCRVGDSDDLAKNVEMILKDPLLAQRLGGQAAIDCQQRYHPAVVARQTAQFYREVIARWEREHRGNRRLKGAEGNRWCSPDATVAGFNQGKH